ncbi:MAG: GNAT family N-acetyltransferase [Roseburia sp.]|nr:GNAT family N-acetyltransferase [Roseburia sp.]MCM1098823.1 GNAT family N-acetyltransferase [Ruminococcus flavefaciens]
MTKREIFATDDELIICTLSDEDRKDYVELHRQLNGETTLYLNPRSKDMMWEQTLNHSEGMFSVFIKKGDYCGSIELQDSDSNTPEIGIDLVENKRNRGIAPRAVRLIAKKVCEEKQIEYFLIRISSANLHSQHVFENLGAVKIGEEESSFSKFVKSFGEIAGKSEQDLASYKYLFGEDSDEIVYQYKLNPNLL